MSKRVEGRENALKRKIQTHLGRMGYRGYEEAWAKEAEKGGLIGEIHKLFDPRARRFFLARVVKDKKGGYLPIPLSSDFDKLVQLEGQLEVGHLTLPPGKDLLWYVIGPEHGGRTRGVGYTVGIREGIHDYKETRKRMTKEQIRDEALATLSERVQTVEGVVAVISKCQTNTSETDSAMMRSCGSPMFGSNDTQVLSKYKIYFGTLLHGNAKRVEYPVPETPWGRKRHRGRQGTFPGRFPKFGDVIDRLDKSRDVS